MNAIIRISDILACIEMPYQLIGRPSSTVYTNINNCDKVNALSIDWVDKSKRNKEEYVAKSEAILIITDPSINIKKLSSDKTFLVVSDPKLAITRIGNKFFVDKPKWGIAATAIINNKSTLKDPIDIGHYSVVNCRSIGSNCVIGPNVFIGENVVIGDSVTIMAGACIGNEGFGFVKNEKNQLEKFPQIGSVYIGNNVEIGANSCIDRGSLSDTIIRDGVKINNLVHIAHNVVIEENCFIGANVYIGGSAEIRQGAWLAPGSKIEDHLIVGSNSKVGLGSVVTKDIPDHETWLGVPARLFRK